MEQNTSLARDGMEINWRPARNSGPFRANAAITLAGGGVPANMAAGATLPPNHGGRDGRSGKANGSPVHRKHPCHFGGALGVCAGLNGAGSGALGRSVCGARALLAIGQGSRRDRCSCQRLHVNAVVPYQRRFCTARRCAASLGGTDTLHYAKLRAHLQHPKEHACCKTAMKEWSSGRHSSLEGRAE